MYEVHRVREDFPVLKEVIYLDNAATTQTPVPVVEAMNEYFFRYAGNYGRGAHRLTRETTNRFEDSREAVARLLEAQPENIVFTRNTTESINMVAYGIEWEKGDHIVTTRIEHHSNLLPWMRLRKKGVSVTIVSPDASGVVPAGNVEAALTGNTRLVAVTQISNVFGSLQDVSAMSEAAHNVGAALLVDAAQSVGHMPVSVKELGCDFLAASGHKGLLGPQGTGLLYIKEPESLEPVYLGGGTVHSVTGDGYKLERPPARFEAGTPNIPGVIGMGRAVKYVIDAGITNIEQHVTSLARSTALRLREIPGVEVYGPEDRHGIVPFNVGTLNPHDVAMILDETRKICVRSGHHCAIPSIDFLGVEGTVRASFAMYSTAEEADLLVETVEQIARTLA
ncbi:MAG TPA: cysteine desulfurase [Candidatus Methanoperedenaceae archaeon]|nr:cysteine desulfurase [Candidatus Methanoperedenaceae archaeon]